jgi:mRNA interferase MazF
MVTFVKGDVIVLPFPFSDLSSSKRRPALVVAKLTGSNLILCSISSQNRTGNKYAIELKTSEMKRGDLKKTSYIHPDIIFTADMGLVSYKIGEITSKKMNIVTNTLVKIFQETI